MRRLLIITGAVLIAAGAMWPWLARLGLGRLPGDIWVRTGRVAFWFPITTCILVSVALSLLLWLLNR